MRPGTPRPNLEAEWDALRAVRGATWAELEFLSEYRAVLHGLNADCPHVVLEDDNLLPSGNGMNDVLDAVDVWARNLDRAEAAVREADDALQRVAILGGHGPTSAHPNSYNNLRPARAVRRPTTGGFASRKAVSFR